MDEKLPAILQWLFSTPGWVPALLATALTGWLMWVSRPLGNSSAQKQSQEPPPNIKQDLSKEPTSAGRSALAPPFDSKGLYVGQMVVETEGLPNGIEIIVRGFNATNRALSVQNIEGALRATEVQDGTPQELGHLPPPYFIEGEGHPDLSNIAHGTEFTLRLGQRVPLAIMGKVQAVSSYRTVSLYCGDLSIVMTTYEKHETVRLPLWDGMTLHRSGEQIHTGRAAIAGGKLFTITRHVKVQDA